MKNYLKSPLFVLALVINMSCGGKQSETTQTETTASSENATTEEAKLKTYKDFLNTLDTTNLASSSKAGEEFQKLFANTDSEINDSAYSLFRDFHERMIMPQQNIIDKDNNSYAGIFGGVEVSKKVAEHQSTLQKNGFNLNQTEGYVYIEASYEFQKKYVFDRLSPAMQSYFNQSQKEIAEGTASDGGLIVEPKILAERVIFWEEFLKKYPNFRWKREVIFEVSSLNNMLFNGLDNTRAFDYETQKLNAAYQEAYNFLMKSEAETQAKKMLSEYYPILLKNKMKDSPQAQAYREKLKN